MKNFFAACVVVVWSVLNASGTSAGMVPKRMVLDNGIVLLTSEQRALPMVSIELLIDAGSRLEAAKQEGLANLTSRLLTFGTKRRSAIELSDALDFMGANLSTGCADNYASVSLTILKKDLTAGLGILAEVLTQASFPQAEIDRQKQAVLASIKADTENPGVVADRAFAGALFPESRYGRPVEGNESSIKAIDQSQMQQFYRNYYRPNRSIVSVVGDVSQAEIANALTTAFRDWRTGEPGGRFAAPKNVGSAQTIRIAKKLTQANIILGHKGVARDDPDYYAIQVMNYILGGGGFSSRAMDSIRNERGLAYSVYSYFDPGKSHGSFQFVMQTKNESAQEAIRIARTEIQRIREEPVSDVELSEAKSYLTGSFPLRFDTNRKVANFLAQVEFFKLGLDYPERYPEFINKITRDDVRRVAQKYLLPEQLITVIVGNLNQIDKP